LANCRTFGFLEEVEAWRQIGLARGGSIENAGGVRRRRFVEFQRPAPADEPVRHKALDRGRRLYCSARR